MGHGMDGSRSPPVASTGGVEGPAAAMRLGVFDAVLVVHSATGGVTDVRPCVLLGVPLLIDEPRSGPFETRKTFGLILLWQFEGDPGEVAG